MFGGKYTRQPLVSGKAQLSRLGLMRCHLILTCVYVPVYQRRSVSARPADLPVRLLT